MFNSLSSLNEMFDLTQRETKNLSFTTFSDWKVQVMVYWPHTGVRLQISAAHCPVKVHTRNSVKVLNMFVMDFLKWRCW